jgi:phage FluMu protein gp41
MTEIGKNIIRTVRELQGTISDAKVESEDITGKTPTTFQEKIESPLKTGYGDLKATAAVLGQLHAPQSLTNIVDRAADNLRSKILENKNS